MSVDGKLYPTYANYDGFLVYPQFEFLSGIQYQVQPGDMFIATYPKCGTTWMSHIVYLILHNGEPMPASENINDHILFMEEMGNEKIEAEPAPRILKTHLPPYLFPVKKQAKYIYIARNPKDCCVSTYFHVLGFAAYKFENGKFDDFFDAFMDGKVEDNDYFDHLLSWNQHLNDENILFVTYEQMKSDLKSIVLKVAKFLGSEHEEKLLQDDSLLQKILDSATLDNMKKMDKQKQWVNGARPENLPFIRKGQMGDWKNYFSEEQSLLMDEKFKERTKGTVFESMWDGII